MKKLTDKRLIESEPGDTCITVGIKDRLVITIVIAADQEKRWTLSPSGFVCWTGVRHCRSSDWEIWWRP